MSKKIKSNKTESVASAKQAAKQKKNKIEKWICIITVCVLAVLITVGIVYTKKNSKTDKVETDNSLFKDKDYTANREAYSGGLDENGNISSVDNVAKYVQLADLSTIILYTKDFPLTNDDKKHAAGARVIDEIVSHSTVKNNDEYYAALKKLYEFIYQETYETVGGTVNNQTATPIFNSIYEFLQVSEEGYNEILEKNATHDMKHFMVVQALYEKLGLKYETADIEAYVYTNDHKALNKKDINITYEKYGKGYVNQRTMEYMVELAILDKVTSKDASIKDKWTDESKFYGAGLNDSGYITSVKDINEFVKLPELKDEDYKHSFDEFIDMLINKSEIMDVSEYVSKLKKRYEHTGEKYSDEEVLKYAKRKLVIQKLFTDYETDEKVKLNFDNFEKMYLSNMSYEEKTKEAYVCGEAYVNQNILEYAVKTYLENKVLQ